MGFGGLGLRQVGSRHLKDSAITTRVLDADAVTSAKIAPDTILAIDINDNAVGSRELAADAVAYANQITNDRIGSRHIADDALSYAAQIKDDIIGSRHLGDDTLSYAAQIKDNILGYGKLTTGLQGSFGAGAIGTGDVTQDKLWLNLEHGRIGSITDYNAEDRVLGSFDFNPTDGAWPVAFAGDTNRLWTIDISEEYVFELGTHTGNILGSFPAPGASSYGMTYADDSKHLWIARADIGNEYVYEYGTAGNVLGSITVLFDQPMSLAYDPVTNRLFCYGATVQYIFEIGTTTGAIVGSFAPPYNEGVGAAPGGMCYAPDKNTLYWGGRGKKYIWELNKSSGNIIGSFQSPATGPTGVVIDTDQYTMFHGDRTGNRIIQMGTAVGRTVAGNYINFSKGFSSKPDVVVTQIGGDNDRVYIEEPSTGSFRLKAGSYPAKAMWMALGSRA